MCRQEVRSAPKVSPASPDQLESKETEDQQVYQDLQVNQDFQLPAGVVVSPDLRASRETEGRRENSALRVWLCRVGQELLGLLEARAHRGPPDLQAFPGTEETASLERPGVPACREREATKEGLARKVIRATPV